MSKEIEAKLQEALYKAVDLTKELGDASDAVAKTASQMALNRKESEFLVNAYNKAKSFALGNNLGEAHRASSFDIADPNKVLNSVFPSEMQKSASDSASITLPSLNMESNFPSIHKAASQVPHKSYISFFPTDQEVREIMFAQRKFSKLKDNLGKTASDLLRSIEDQEFKNRYTMKEKLYKAAGFISKFPEDRLKKTAQRIRNYFDSDTGKIVLESLSKVSGREFPKVKKTASHAVLPTDKIYAQLADARECAVKIRRNEKLKARLSKTAVNPAEAITAKAIGKFPGADIIRRNMGYIPREKTYLESMPPDLYQQLEGLESREAFMKAVLTNPVLQDFSLEALQDSFNYAIETNPELIKTPRSLGNIMLANIQQGNIDSIDQLAAKKQMSKGEAERSKAKADAALKEEAQAQTELDKQRWLKAKKSPGEGELSPPGESWYKQVKEKIQPAIEQWRKEKEEQEKEERRDIEESKQEYQDIKNTLRDVIPLYTERIRKTREVRPGQPSGFTGIRTPRQTHTDITRRGLSDIPVRVGGTQTTLDPKVYIGLERARHEGRLSPQGEKLYSKIKDFTENIGYKDLSKQEFEQQLEEYEEGASRRGFVTGVDNIKELFSEG